MEYLIGVYGYGLPETSDFDVKTPRHLHLPRSLAQPHGERW